MQGLFTSDFRIGQSIDGVRFDGFGTDVVTNRGGQWQGDTPLAGLMNTSNIHSLPGVRFDPGVLRPYFDDFGNPCVVINTGRKKRVEVKNAKGTVTGYKYKPEYAEVRIKDLRDAGVQLPLVTNTTSLRKEEWLQLDQQVIPPQRTRLRLYNDIARMYTYSFNGMGTMILEHETLSDPGTAYQDMNGLSEGTTDTPEFQLEGQPIPITHASFTYDLRRLTISRQMGTPLNTRGVEWATRRVVELIENTAIGIGSGVVEYGGASTYIGGYGTTPGVYGLLNYPHRIVTTSNHIPNGNNMDTIFQDVLGMRDLLYAAKHYGPYGIYHSTDYDRYLDAMYAITNGSGYAVNPSQTVRQAILSIGTEEDGETPVKQIRFVKRLDQLTPTAAGSSAFRMFMVSLNPNVIRALNGMPVTVFQYDTKGGWELHFKVACMLLTEMFSDFYGNCGILDARATV